MRRTDREILDEKKILQIIEACDCCRLGLCDGEAPYVVPLNFAHCMEGEKHIFYFHSAKAGRKIELIRKNKKAGFEMDTAHSVQSAVKACGYTFKYQSVIGQGDVDLVKTRDKKRKALQMIMGHYSGRSDWQFEDQMVDAVEIIRLEVSKLSCKENM